MSKTSVLIASLAVVVVFGGAYWLMSGAGNASSNSMVPIPASSQTDQNKNAVANQWQWQNFTGGNKAAADNTDETEEPAPVTEVHYAVVRLYNILQTVELDANGRVVPNQAARLALDRGFSDLGPDLSEEALAELQELIRIGLPGEAGEESAQILEQYYQLRLAEEALNQQMEARITEETNPQAGLEHYEQLSQLRRRYLGNDIADGLYELEDIQVRHMYATIAVQQNDELTDEEKQAELAALQTALNDRLLSIDQVEPEMVASEKVESLRKQGASSTEIYNAREEILGTQRAMELAEADREEVRWESNFSGFWQARQQVLDAGLSDVESERQIEQLYDQYFTAEQQERARSTSLEWQGRERE